MPSPSLPQRLLAHIRAHALLRAGDRVGAAVSGGADSLAMLHLLLELRQELGIVLSVVHFDHGIRGPASAADAEFVAAQASRHKLQIFLDFGDAPAYAAANSISLETAARDLRYKYFRHLLDTMPLDRIATAHTLNDQAETVLMRVVRGAGTRGTAGIHPSLALGAGTVVRPLLEFERGELEEYLRALHLEWREDPTNLDLHHLRNRVRHELLPLLAREYNPNIVRSLARTAEVARKEEQYWEKLAAEALPHLLRHGKPVRGGGRAAGPSSAKSLALDLEKLRAHPLALQRRLVRAAAQLLACELDAEHVESLLNVAANKIKQAELPGGLLARRSFRELQLTLASASCTDGGYEYPLQPMCELLVAETGTSFRAVPRAASGYNSAHAPLSVRNLRAGDRFWAAGHSADKKLKDLLKKMQLPQAERALWPLVVEGDRVVWVRGLAPHPDLQRAFDIEEGPGPERQA